MIRQSRKKEKKVYQSRMGYAILYKLNWHVLKSHGKDEPPVQKTLRFGVMLVLVLLCTTASGCSGLKFSSVDDLYSLPSLPAEYENLETQINDILDDGAEYAAPVSGSNIQPVQMADLNGDGQEEALVFMRKSTDDKPLKIYIFGTKNGTYQQIAVIEGSGSSIYSVVYSDLNGDGKNELIVGWKVASELQVLSVYTLRGNEPVELMRTNYVKYALTDLDSNGVQELVTLHADNQGGGVADLYTWQSGTLALRSSAAISVTMAELNNLGRVTSGTIQGGKPALYVVGVGDSSSQITDILTMRQGDLVNIALSDITGASSIVARYLSLYPTDINDDGVTEVPIPAPLPSPGETDETNYQVEWYSYDADGKAKAVVSTYHDIDDGWYLTLPSTWLGHIAVNRSMSGSDETVVTFYIRGQGLDGYQDFMRIYTITGASREVKAVRDKRFILKRQAETIYSARLQDANKTWEYGMTEDQLRTSFSLITTEWATGDY